MIVELLKPRRPPDFVIGGSERPYMLRWHLIRTRWFRVFLHKILRDDDDRATHDHPWWNVSIILRGSYVEVLPDKRNLPTPHARITDMPQVRKLRRRGCIVFRRATDCHRLELPTDGPGIRYVWSLFIAGRRVREWGFHCDHGFVPWQDFVASDDPGAVGKGCDQ